MDGDLGCVAAVLVVLAAKVLGLVAAVVVVVWTLQWMGVL